MIPINAISPPVATSQVIETQWQTTEQNMPETDRTLSSGAVNEPARFSATLAAHAIKQTAVDANIAMAARALDAQSDKMHAAMERLAFERSNGQGASTEAMIALQSTQIQTFVVYEGAARAIGLTTQGITELMRMQ